MSSEVQKIVNDEFMSSLIEEVNKIGPTRMAKFKNELISVTFVNHSNALDAAAVGTIKVNLTFLPAAPSGY